MFSQTLTLDKYPGLMIIWRQSDRTCQLSYLHFLHPSKWSAFLNSTPGPLHFDWSANFMKPSQFQLLQSRTLHPLAAVSQLMWLCKGPLLQSCMGQVTATIFFPLSCPWNLTACFCIEHDCSVFCKT